MLTRRKPAGRSSNHEFPGLAIHISSPEEKEPLPIMISRISCVVAAASMALAGASAPGTARADLLFTGSNGTLSASADFALSGNTLTITLTNTSPYDVLVPGDVLTGLFFNTAHTLTPLSASLNGSSVYDGSIKYNVGEGWQYKTFASGGPQGENAGISATGLGLFGPNGNFYTPLPGQQSNPNLGGVDYGIVSAGDNPATGNGGISGHGPFIKDSIVFTLTAGQGFVLTDLGDSVVFQYGTSLTETHLTGTPPVTNPHDSPAVPEPSSMAIALTALAGAGFWRRTRA